MVKSPTPKTGIILVALGIALIGGTRPRLVATMEISAAPTCAATCATPSGCRVIGRPVKRSEWWLATTPVRRVAPVVATGSITGILLWAGPILFIIVINTQIAYSFWHSADNAFMSGWSRTTKVLSKRTLLFGWWDLWGMGTFSNFSLSHLWRYQCCNPWVLTRGPCHVFVREHYHGICQQTGLLRRHSHTKAWVQKC